MDFKKFAELTRDIVDQYYKHVDSLRSASDVTFLRPILFPSMMLAHKFKDHYLAEFIGLRSQYSGLAMKKMLDSSIDQYFCMTDEPLFECFFENPIDNNIMQNFVISPDEDFEEIRNRFPIIDLMGSKLVAKSKNLFGLGNEFKSLSLSNIVLISKKDNFYRCKNILAAFLFPRSITKRQLAERLKFYLPSYAEEGEHTLRYVVTGGDKSDENIILASQLQNLYLSKDIRETTIGEFLKQHDESVKRAFKTTHIIYEPSLDWIEHDGIREKKAIKPDLFVRRADGFYDIYDLKTAALERPNLITGVNDRFRPIVYVSDGVTQLHNYAEYFDYDLNARHAFEKYGIRVENPRLYLVVGNVENANPVVMERVMGRFRRDVNVIDYDTVSMWLTK